jgi:hypothetical protein
MTEHNEAQSQQPDRLQGQRVDQALEGLGRQIERVQRELSDLKRSWRAVYEKSIKQ